MVKTLEDLLSVQKDVIHNSQCAEQYYYSVGVYNGMEISRAIAANEEPKFYKEGDENDGC